MGYSSSEVSPFSLLPPTRTPWTEFVFSIGTQACVVALLVWVRLLHPGIVSAPEHSFHSIQLVSTPVPVDHQPQPERRVPLPEETVKLDSSMIDSPVEALRLPAPRPRPPKVMDAPAPSVTLASPKMNPLPPLPAPATPKMIATNVFSTGSSAAPTSAHSPEQIQTGGFGDPNGIPAKNNRGKAVNIAAAGSFDLPSGAGYGNGTGGSKGRPGIVASAGFGNSIAVGDSPLRPSKLKAVASSGFADADVPAPPTVHSRASATTSSTAAAEIISKPTPAYTSEARSLRIEGEVLLDVVLEASGRLHVLRVVRGLGHGLDDNAVKAAEQIRFKPATRNGQPTDSQVVLHIIFQLA